MTRHQMFLISRIVGCVYEKIRPSSRAYMHDPIVAGRRCMKELIFQRVRGYGNKSSRHTDCWLIWQISLELQASTSSTSRMLVRSGINSATRCVNEAWPNRNPNWPNPLSGGVREQWLATQHSFLDEMTSGRESPLIPRPHGVASDSC